jgi:hypothetical protein
MPQESFENALVIAAALDWRATQVDRAKSRFAQRNLVEQNLKKAVDAYLAADVRAPSHRPLSPPLQAQTDGSGIP